MRSILHRTHYFPAIVALGFIAVALHGQATPPPTSSSQAEREDACGPQHVHFSVHTDKRQHPIPAPLEGKAMVFVIQKNEAGTVGFALDGKWMGATEYRSYFFFPVEPGEHHVCSRDVGFLGSGKPLFDSFDAVPGQTYYFSKTPEHPYTHDWRPHLVHDLDRDQAKLLISQSALSTTEIH
jgi:hypothetical protein